MLKTKRVLKRGSMTCLPPPHTLQQPPPPWFYFTESSARIVSVKVFRAPSWSCSLERRVGKRRNDRQIDRTKLYTRTKIRKNRRAPSFSRLSNPPLTRHPIRAAADDEPTRCRRLLVTIVDEPHTALFHFLFLFLLLVVSWINRPPFYFGVLGPIRSIGCEVINITGCHAARCVDCWPSGVSLWFTTLVSVDYTPLFCFYFFCEWVNTCRMYMFPVRTTIRPGKYLNQHCWIGWNDLSVFRIILTIYGWKIYSEWREAYRRLTFISFASFLYK